jgi:hypothetical protein
MARSLEQMASQDARALSGANEMRAGNSFPLRALERQRSQGGVKAATACEQRKKGCPHACEVNELSFVLGVFRQLGFLLQPYEFPG